MHGTMHIDQVVRRVSRRPTAAACCTGSFPVAPVEASLVEACYWTSKSTCQAAEHGSNAQEHGGGCASYDSNEALRNDWADFDLDAFWAPPGQLKATFSFECLTFSIKNRRFPFRTTATN